VEVYVLDGEDEYNDDDDDDDSEDGLFKVIRTCK
jgi:hypothetical protein